jgi:hypothetical protein
MRLLAVSILFAGAMLAVPQQQSPQNSQDVPTEKPGTANPDVSKQREPAHKSDGNNAQQQKADVPNQEPSTSNPDVGKQRQPTPNKKKRRDTSSNTATST